MARRPFSSSTEDIFKTLREAQRGVEEAKRAEKRGLAAKKRFRQRIKQKKEDIKAQEEAPGNPPVVSKRKPKAAARIYRINQISGGKCQLCNESFHHSCLLLQAATIDGQPRRRVVCRVCLAQENEARKFTRRSPKVFRNEPRVRIDGPAIRARRLALEMSMKEFCRRMKWTAAYQVKIELGSVRTVAQPVAEKMSEILGVEVQWNDGEIGGRLGS